VLLVQAQKRMWIIDSQACAIAYELRRDLGDWLLRVHNTNIKRHQATARASIGECTTHTIQQLCEAWQTHTATLISLRSRM
jgi:hypothetical protein